MTITTLPLPPKSKEDMEAEADCMEDDAPAVVEFVDYIPMYDSFWD